MEKFLDIAKGIFAGFVELLVHPVTKVTEIVQKENIKKGAIKGAIVAFVLSIVSVLATIRMIYIANTSGKARDAYVEALNPILSILRTFVIYVLVIIAVALVLFFISKLVKDQKSLPYTLSMTVNSAAVLTVGSVLALALSFWTPLSVFVIMLASLHSGLTLLVSFMSSLTNVNTDKLILVSVAIIAVVAIILTIINNIKYDQKLSSYTDGKFGEKTQYGDVGYYKYKKTLKKLSKDSDSTMSDMSDALDAIDSLSGGSLSSLF